MGSQAPFIVQHSASASGAQAWSRSDFHCSVPVKMSRRLARFPQVRVHPGALAAKSDSPSLSPTRSSSNTFSTNSSGGAARPAGSRPGQSAGATSSNPLWPSVVRRTGTPQTPYGSGGAERARGLSGSNNKSGEDDDAHDAANLAELKIAGGSSSASSSRSSSPPTPDSVADLATAESDRNGTNSSSGGSSTTTAPGSSSSNGGAQRVGTATALRRRTAAAAGSVGRSLVASVPKLKVCVRQLPFKNIGRKFPTPPTHSSELVSFLLMTYPFLGKLNAIRCGVSGVTRILPSSWPFWPFLWHSLLFRQFLSHFFLSQREPPPFFRSHPAFNLCIFMNNLYRWCSTWTSA